MPFLGSTFGVLDFAAQMAFVAHSPAVVSVRRLVFSRLRPSPLMSPFHDQQLIAFKEQVLMRVVPTLSEIWKEGSQEVRGWERAVSPLHPTHHHHHTPLNNVDRRCTLQQQCRFAPGTICDVSASCPPKKPRNAMRC